MATEAKLPPLPLASITEGSHILYSAAQLREYGLAYHSLGHDHGYLAGRADALREAKGATSKPGEVPDFFSSVFGAKK